MLLQIDSLLLFGQNALIVLQFFGSDRIRFPPLSLLLLLSLVLVRPLLFQLNSSSLVLHSPPLFILLPPLFIHPLSLRNLRQRLLISLLQLSLLLLEFPPFLLESVSFNLDSAALVVQLPVVVVRGFPQLFDLLHLRVQSRLSRFVLLPHPFFFGFSLPLHLRLDSLLLRQHALLVVVVLPLLFLQPFPVRLDLEIGGGDFLLDGRHLRRRHFRQFPRVFLLHLLLQRLQSVLIVLDALAFGFDFGAIRFFRPPSFLLFLLYPCFVGDSILFRRSFDLFRLPL